MFMFRFLSINRATVEKVTKSNKLFFGSTSFPRCFHWLIAQKQKKVTIADYLFLKICYFYLVEHYKRCPICRIFAVIPMLSQRHLCRSK